MAEELPPDLDWVRDTLSQSLWYAANAASLNGVSKRESALERAEANPQSEVAWDNVEQAVRRLQRAVSLDRSL
jgi:hypothetical protein